jgi:hypothetical protein
VSVGAARRELEGRALARMELDRRTLQKRYSEDAWFWLSRCVYTEDPLEKRFAPFPANEPWAQYLRVPTALYQNPDVRLRVMRKSRRMIISWLEIALRVWRAAKFTHEVIYFVALKLGLHVNEGSLEMVKRATQILEHLTNDSIVYEPYRDHIDFPQTRSRIIAVAQGADQLRGVPATDILMDECAFWPLAEETFTAARPTIEGRGRITMVSTVNPGSFFSGFAKDQIGRPKHLTLPPPTIETPMTGITVRRNPGNRATVVDVHYTADPRKRTPEWKAAESAGQTEHGWQREYEMNDDLFAGLPVLEGAYDEATMAKPAPLALDPKRPIIRGWDWGYTHPCVVLGQFFESRQLRIFRAWLGHYTDLEPFASDVLRKCRERWPRMDFLDCGDFAGNQRKGTGPPEVDVMREKFGVQVLTRYMREEEPLAWLRQDLMRRLFRPGEPCFLVEVNEETEEFRRALRGGWHLDRNGKPANDGLYEHYGDALKAFKNYEFDGTPYLRELETAADADILRAKPDW